ncbi:hypothetical protein PV326_011710 [Microctonus aethiopoides]|nr:hypothetical protein PV326_011710 [Microctonus aethiopoides]
MVGELLMYLYKVIVLLAAFLALSSAYIQPQVDDLQAEETNIAQTRQKRAPLLLKKLLLAKKALIIGGGAGLVGGGVGGALVQKWSQGGNRHPIYTGGPAPSYPIYQEKPPVYYDPAPPAVRPPVYYYNQYPSAPVVSNPSGHYGAAFYISKVHSKPLPPPPSVNADCYSAGTSSYNSAAATSNAGYA